MRWYQKAKARARSEGVTYDQLGEELSVSKGAVAHWMSGRNQPTIEQVIIIARMLNMTVAELTGEDRYFIHAPTDRAILDLIRDIDDTEKETIKRLIAAYLEANKPD